MKRVFCVQRLKNEENLLNIYLGNAAEMLQVYGKTYRPKAKRMKDLRKQNTQKKTALKKIRSIPKGALSNE